MYILQCVLQAVKLESMYPSRHRYLTVVSTTGRQDSEESVILGMCGVALYVYLYQKCFFSFYLYSSWKVTNELLKCKKLL